MLQGIGFAPMAPLLRPEIAGGAAHELDGVRSAISVCFEQVSTPATTLLMLVPDSGAEIAQWMASDRAQPTQIISIPDDPDSVAIDNCAAQIQRLARSDEVSLVVLGDGSACRSEKAPGYLDARAEPFDAEIAAALTHPDPGFLANLDVRLARELQAAGRATWPIAGRVARDQTWRASFFDMQDPYGVAYFVASWVAVRSGIGGIGSVTT